MTILETIQLVILGLIVAILMWDNVAAHQAAHLASGSGTTTTAAPGADPVARG